MAENLQGFKVAILATEGFEQSELIEPRKALQDTGAFVTIVSPGQLKIRGWQNNNWADIVHADILLADARAEDYDALMLPGGVINPDRLRLIPQAIDFIKKFVDAKKPIAATCHGPWTLINARGVRGYTMTAWPSLQIDLENAGATWVDKEVVTSNNLVTSRKPADLPVFNKAMIALFSQYKK
jgi:protease I